jgi:hypothetical protein
MKVIARVVALGVAGLLMLGVVPTHAGVVNGGFETGDFSGWSTIGNASVVTAAFGTPTAGGTYHALLQTGLTPNDGATGATDSAIEAFLGLGAGAIDAFCSANVSNCAASATDGAAMKQTLSVTAGQVVTFKYNFLTSEQTPSVFNDFAFLSVGGSIVSLLADTTSAFVVSPTGYADETGYQTFSYTFTSGGLVDIGFAVFNEGDNILDSALLVDNVNIPEPSTLVLLGAGLAAVGLARRRARA